MRVAAFRLVTAGAAVCASAAAVHSQAIRIPLDKPIRDDPVPSSLGIVVREIATFPKSNPTPAPTDPRLMRQARINYLGEIPDGSHRKFVPDLNGTLYALRGDTITPYLDVRAT